MTARKICSTIERNLLNALHHWTFHSKKGPKQWFSMTIGILASSNLRNRKSISVRNSKFSSVSSKKTLRVLAILKVTDAMWRHTVSRTESLIPLETPPPWFFFIFSFFFFCCCCCCFFFEVLVKTTIKIYYSDKTIKRLSSYKLASVYCKILEYKNFKWFTLSIVTISQNSFAPQN